jgi:hypothetical protein
METSAQPVTKKSNIGLIIGLLLLVFLCLCCCCCLLIGGWGSYALTRQANSLNDSFQTPFVPEIPVIPLPTDESGGGPAMPANVIPQGGLGDDLQRTNAWVSVLLNAGMSGCLATDGTQTSIEVLQEPDSDGIWKEKWTVTCEDGSRKPYDLTFTPRSDGSTEVAVTPGQ